MTIVLIVLLVLLLGGGGMYGRGAGWGMGAYGRRSRRGAPAGAAFALAGGAPVSTLGVFSADHINNTPCFKLAAFAWNDLVQRGMSPLEVALSYDQRGVWAQQDGEVVGVLVWLVQDHIKTGFVQLSFVVPEKRQQGVYKAMVESSRMPRSLQL